MEKRYCAIIFINEQIGEFVYLVEGTSDLPLPSALLPMDSPNMLCISSMLEGQSEMPVLHFKCCLPDILREKLKIPLINEAREKALAIAAQQQMSVMEYERRKITGTLESSSVRVAVAALGLSTVERDSLHNLSTYPEQYIVYNVEVSMPDYFEIPYKIYIPVLASARVNVTHLENGNCFATETVSLSAICQYPKQGGKAPATSLSPSRLLGLDCSHDLDRSYRGFNLALPEMGGGPKNGADLEPASQEPGRSRARQDLKLARQLKVPAGAGRGTVAATLIRLFHHCGAGGGWSAGLSVAATVPCPAPAGTFSCQAGFRSCSAWLLPGSCETGARLALFFGPTMSQDSLTLPKIGGGPKNEANLEPALQEPGRSQVRQDLKPAQQLKALAGAGWGTVAAMLRPMAQPPPAPQQRKSWISSQLLPLRN
uniref:Uncharacterized protein n=1 Tax=Sphaerodactylus townsendi TaxID=933632 RepID=A0ACB8FIX5_9SAUR